MNEILGFNGHRYGDLMINIAPSRILKEVWKNSHLTFVINGNYRECAPLFIDHPYIDKIYITDSPVGGFNEKDIQWINSQKFSHIFDPMKDHDHSNPWWMQRHQTLEAANMHGLPYEENYKKLYLKKWFNVSPNLENFIAFQPFAGSYDPNNKKMLSKEKAQQIANLIKEAGYKVLQLGGPNELQLEGTYFPHTDYFTAARNMLGCKMLIGTDSSFTWLSSCYDFPTLALYSNEYYGEEFVKNIQPVNPNAVYLDERSLNQISLDKIEEQLNNML